jgi:ribosomal protein L4
MQNKANTIAAMLDNASVTFANIAYTSTVATAAAHKHVVVEKQVVANVQLFANIKQATAVFANAVKKSAANNAANDAADVAAFTQQSNYFTHTACYSIVEHKTNAKQYLYAIFNNVSSTVYTIDNVVATKQQVAELLTKSAAAKLLQKDNTVVNKTHNIAHNVQVRTIALDNVTSVTANKQTVVFK